MKSIKMFLSLVCLMGLTVFADTEKNIVVELKAPDATWSISIDMVYLVGEELWVISSLSQADGMMGAQVITTVKDSVKVTAGDFPVKHYVMGKTWNWENEEAITFIKGLDAIKEKLGEGKLLYPKS